PGAAVVRRLQHSCVGRAVERAASSEGDGVELPLRNAGGGTPALAAVGAAVVGRIVEDVERAWAFEDDPFHLLPRIRHSLPRLPGVAALEEAGGRARPHGA